MSSDSGVVRALIQRTGIAADHYQTVPILCYHRFGPGNSKMVMAPNRFATQLDWLARNGYTVIRLAELRDFLAADPERLAYAFLAHLSRYATGTEASFADRAEIRRIVESTKSGGHGLRSLIQALAESEIFHTQQPIKNGR